MAVLDADDVVSFHAQQPDQSRWYGGDDDLSAVLWAGADHQHVYLVARVRDQQHTATLPGGRPGDHLALELASAAGVTDVRVVPEGDAAAVQVRSVKGSDDPAGGAEAVIRRLDGTTWYNVALPRSLWPGEPRHLRVTVRDTDDPAWGRKQDAVTAEDDARIWLR
jgi:hypothetical protein